MAKRAGHRVALWRYIAQHARCFANITMYHAGNALNGIVDFRNLFLDPEVSGQRGVFCWRRFGRGAVYTFDLEFCAKCAGRFEAIASGFAVSTCLAGNGCSPPLGKASVRNRRRGLTRWVTLLVCSSLALPFVW